MSSILLKGYKHLPVSALVTTSMVVIALAGSIFNIKSYFLLAYSPFISEWHQWWRLLLYQFQFQNESQLVIGVVLFTMNYKSLERVFGSLKFIKVLTLLYFYNVIFMGTLLFLCYAVLRINIYIPSGPFGILFGLLYPYFKFAPTLYSFELDFGGLGKSQHNNDNDNNDHENENEYGNDIEESSGNSEKYRITFTNNFVTAILAVQLLLSEGFISSPIACLVGYFVSSLLFSDVLPLLNSRFFILDSLYTRWTRKPSEGRQQSLDAHIQNLAASSEEQDLPASGNASIRVGESSRSLTPPENVERAVEDQEENEQDTDIPARSLGTQLLDTFRR